MNRHGLVKIPLTVGVVVFGFFLYCLAFSQAEAADAAVQPHDDVLLVFRGITPVRISVLANDTALPGGTLSVASFTQPLHGMVAAAADDANALVYTPDGSYVGSDYFHYTASDGIGGTASATVLVTEVAGAPGALDLGFNLSGYVKGAGGTVVQPDRKVLAYAGFGGSVEVSRYNEDGTADVTFGGLGKTVIPTASEYYPNPNNPAVRYFAGYSILPVAAALGTDGKLVVGGSYGTYGSQNTISYDGAVAFKVNPNGLLDTAFDNLDPLHPPGTGDTYSPLVTTHIGTVTNGAAVALQTDGKTLIAGFSDDAIAIVRTLVNGSPDISFGQGGIVTTALVGSASAKSLAVQADGKIVIAATDVLHHFLVIRYLADGTLDPSFGSGGVVRTTIGDASSATAVVILPGGSILVGGSTVLAGSTRYAIAKYTAAGAPDNSLGGTGVVIGATGGSGALAVQSDGKILIPGNIAGISVRRLYADGTIESTFGTNSVASVAIPNDQTPVRSIAVTQDGKIVVSTASSIARFFGTVSGVFPQEAELPVITVPDILVDAEATGAAGAAVSFIATAKDPQGGSVPVIASPSSGSVFPLGSTTVYLTAKNVITGREAAAAFVVRVSDHTGPAITVPPVVNAQIADEGSGVVVDFSVSATDLVDGPVTVTLNHASGSVYPLGDTYVSAYATDSRGNSSYASFIVSVTDATDPAVPNTISMLDTSFGDWGYLSLPISDVLVQPDLKVIAVQDDGFRARVSRFNTDGTLDPTYNPLGADQIDFPYDEVQYGTAESVATAALDGSGNLVLGGSSGSFYFAGSSAVPTISLTKLSLYRLTSSGVLDITLAQQGTFDTAGFIHTTVGDIARGRAAAIQADGKILLAGTSDGSAVIARYLPDGTLDSSFGSGGVVRSPFSGAASAVGIAVIEGNQKIVIAATDALHTFLVAQYLPDGSVDTSFGTNGLVRTAIADSSNATAVRVIQGTGIVVAGSAMVGGRPRYAVAEYDFAGLPLPTFGTDGVVMGGTSGAGPLAIQSDGKLLLPGGLKGLSVRRLNADGSLDTSFGTNGFASLQVPGDASPTRSIAVATDGKIVAANNSALVRFLPVASATSPVIAPRFGPIVDPLIASATAPNGAHVVFNVTAKDALEGSLLVIATPPSGSLFPIGDTIVHLTTQNSKGDSSAAQFTVRVVDDVAPVITAPVFKSATTSDANGVGVEFDVSATDAVEGEVTPTVDHASGSNFPVGVTQVHVSAHDSSGNVAEKTFAVTVTYVPYLFPTTPLMVDTSLSGSGYVTAEGIEGILAPQDGRFIVFGSEGYESASYARRFDADGTPDTTFSASHPYQLVSVPDGIAYRLVSGLLKADGNVVLGGAIGFLHYNPPPYHSYANFYNLSPFQLTDVGDLDAAFLNASSSGSANGIPSRGAIALQDDGRIVMGGAYGGNAILARWLPGGAKDETFGQAGVASLLFGGAASVSDVAIQSDGKILATITDSLHTFVLARYLANGTLDPDFGAGGIVRTVLGDSSAASALVLPPGGGILVAGSAVVGNVDRYAVVKYDANGALDSSFNGTGKVVGVGSGAGALALQSDGKILLPGNLIGLSVRRLNADGTLDTTFGANGVASILIPSDSTPTLSIAVAPDGMIFAASSGAVARFRSTALVGAPVFGPIADPLIVEATGPSGAITTFAVTATDASDGPVPVNAAPESGSTFELGDTVVHLTAQNSRGGVSTSQFTVRVVDTTPPVITVPSPVLVDVTNLSGAVAIFSVSASDTVSGSVTAIADHPSGSLFPLGNTVVQVTTQDGAGNHSAASFIVTVRDISVADTIPPVITAPSSLVVLKTGSGGAVVNFTVSALDAFSGPVDVVVDHPSGSLFPVGSTIVHLYAQDAAGNSATQSFVVTVLNGSTSDTVPPVISVSASLEVEAVNASGAPVTFVVSALDAQSGNVIPTVDHSSGSVFPLGETVVHVSAQDELGNTSTASFCVTVKDTTAPQITLPSPIFTTTAEISGKEVTFAVTAADAVDGSVTVSLDHASGSLFPVGITTIHATAHDSAGNSASASFTVDVRVSSAVSGTVYSTGGLPQVGQQPVPGLWAALRAPTVNEAGQIAFLGTWALGSEKHDSIIADETEVATTGEPAPQGFYGNGTFSSFGDPVIANDGSVAFFATIKTASGKARALISNIGGVLRIVAAENNLLRNDAGEKIKGIQSFAVENGVVAFLAKRKTDIFLRPINGSVLCTWTPAGGAVPLLTTGSSFNDSVLKSITTFAAAPSNSSYSRNWLRLDETGKPVVRARGKFGNGTQSLFEISEPGEANLLSTSGPNGTGGAQTSAYFKSYGCQRLAQMRRASLSMRPSTPAQDSVPAASLRGPRVEMRFIPWP